MQNDNLVLTPQETRKMKIIGWVTMAGCVIAGFALGRKTK